MVWSHLWHAWQHVQGGCCTGACFGSLTPCMRTLHGMLQHSDYTGPACVFIPCMQALGSWCGCSQTYWSSCSNLA